MKLSTVIHMPKYSKTEDEDKLLNDLCQRKLSEIIQDKKSPQIYVDRLERELSVIKSKGFSGYFLIVYDYINHARRNNIAVGAGRGSAAGSLVSYLLEFSQADPIKYGLLFERFLDPNRSAIPDIDVDLAPDKRDEMFNYLIQRYEQDCCSLVSTFHIRKAGGALKDAARLYGVPPETANEFSKLIPHVYYSDDGSKMIDLPIKTALEISNELKAQAKLYPEVFELAAKLEGLPSSVGIHAAGMLVSPIPLTDSIPLTRTNKEGILATSLDLQDAENCFVKYDLLSPATASLIAATENDVGWKFNYRDESLLNDERVWKVIGSKNTVGIFQIASSTYKTRMPRLKPKSIRELAACLALIRSPSIIAKTDQLYMEIEEGKRQIELVHPIYDEITAEINGVLLYQEQIMHLAVAFGFDLSTGYKIVKLSAKKMVNDLRKFRVEFVTKAAQKKCDAPTANRIFDLIEQSGLYSFNLSHAVSYALIAYASAYMKVHYPTEYMKNLLTNTWSRGEKDDYDDVLKECKRLKIKFLPVDINKSEYEFTVEDAKIRIGLCAVKGLGQKAVNEILAAKPFADVDDMLGQVSRRIVNKKSVSALIFAGAFDYVNLDRRAVYSAYIEKYYGEVPEEVNIGADVKLNLSDSKDVWQTELLSGKFL